MNEVGSGLPTDFRLRTRFYMKLNGPLGWNLKYIRYVHKLRSYTCLDVMCVHFHLHKRTWCGYFNLHMHTMSTKGEFPCRPLAHHNCHLMTLGVQVHLLISWHEHVQ